MATDATFIDEASAVVRKLLQAHGRELAARQVAEDLSGSARFRDSADASVVSHAAVTDAAIVELVMTLDDRMQDHIVRLVKATGLSLPESTS